MKRTWFLIGSIAVVAALAFAAAAGARTSRADDSLTGAGSTFVAPLVNKWIGVFQPKAGIDMTYGAIGSGGGIAQITARTVDYGASDAPLTGDQFAACKLCLQIPWAVSSTAIIYNLPGVTKQLRISGPLLANIYLGNITKWDDPQLTKLNPGVNLPSTNITPVYRSDGSGTSYNVTQYMSKVSPAFQSTIGVSTQPPFKVGSGARGSSGVAGAVANTQGAIGYVDVNYALTNHLRFFAVQNQAGLFQTPGIKPTIAAANTAVVAQDNSISIVDPSKSAKGAYPIGTFTYIIVPATSGKAKLLKQWILFAISPQGQQLGLPLIFAPLPKNVAVADAKAIGKITQG